jgi:DNA-binding NarL/FixJ family response regulator
MPKPAPAVEKIRIVVADDHTIFREGLCRLLGTEAGFEVVGEAGDGRSAIHVASRLEPDILLLDFTMPQASGLEVLRALQEKPHIRSVLLTAGMEKQQLIAALQLGARGIVLKHLGAEMLTRAIRSVMNGEYWVDRTTLAEWAKQSNASPASSLRTFTFRELAVIREVAAGRSNREIAERLSITEDTVKRHLTNIFDKVGLSSRLELALYAIHNHMAE